MHLRIPSPVLIKDLSSPGGAVMGEAVRHEGRRIEISAVLVLPVGAAVSIEIGTYLLLGHVIGFVPGRGDESGTQSACLIYIDQSLNLASSPWPQWTESHHGGANQKQEPLLAP